MIGFLGCIGKLGCITSPTKQFSVLDSDGNQFNVTRDVLDSDGNLFTVPQTVLDSDGNSFTPL